MELSDRLAAVAALVTKGRVVADIGTDHGYIPIYLIESGVCKKAYAMDVRKGPLKRAEEHITGHGLGNYIEIRLSDGLGALAPGEADCMIAAGMGGNLIIKILEEGREVLEEMQECILQPQSDIARVRRWLDENGYVTKAEDMVLEDGKYYPMMKLVKRPKEAGCGSELEYRYGRLLLREKHPVLKKYLEKELAGKEQILAGLERQNSERAKERAGQIKEELEMIREGLKCFAEKS